ncbi:MAG: DUF5011 domain-containing protein [Oscillospiraceae bacterium]|nr:DUF5011 domain-containing protein [Oscillospiraceae bacterium]
MRILKILLIILLAVVTLAYGTTEITSRLSGTNDTPVISCDSDTLEISVSADRQVLLESVTASDAQDGDLTSAIRISGISKFIDDATTKITYLVFDSDNNVGSLTRTIRYTDYVSPRISITEPLVYSSGENIVLLDRLLVEDCIDGDITDSVRVSTLNSSNETAVYSMDLRVTNSMDDTVQLTLPVVRYPDNAEHPEITLTSYLVYLEQGSSFSPRDYVSYVRTSDGIIGKTEVRVSGSVDTSVSGTYMVRYSYIHNGVEGIALLTVVVE